MIKSVRINNFKGLEKFELHDVGRINLLGGKNNSGKTTVLEALFMLYDRLNPNIIIRQYNGRGVMEIEATSEAIFSPIFRNFNMDNKIEIEVTDDNSFRETMFVSCEDNGKKVVTMNGNDGKIKTDERVISLTSLEIKVRSSKYKEQHIRLILDVNGMQFETSSVSHSKTASFLPAKLNINPSENAIQFGKLYIKGQADVIIDFLKIIEPRLTSLSTIPSTNNTSMIYGNIGIGTLVPLSYMGDGISRLMTILLAIVSNKDGVVFIDEIENGIHYSVLSKVWEIISRAAADYNCQVFATTHSYECLSAAIKGIVREDVKNDFRYYRIEQSTKQQKVISKKFDFEMLETSIERGWEVR